ncbi:MAG: HD domain-containing protein [Thermodesulfovibrionales bacterium]|nr:HD domain-containing protein [Thermodesulfovibrionales bacterium]
MLQSGLLQKKTDAKPSLEALRSNEKARLYIELADRYLESLGYTEHGFRHCDIVSRTADNILKKLSYPEKDVELAAVAGFLHDVGNMLGRAHHHRMGALLAKEVLEELGYELRDIGKVMMAIIIHEEDEGSIPDPVAAALLIADKSDVHRSRVRSPSMVGTDIHDRVNYAATESELSVEPDKKLITLSLVIDTRISQVIEYFEIFLSRMTACRKAAKVLGCEFQLFINNTRLA